MNILLNEAQIHSLIISEGLEKNLLLEADDVFQMIDLWIKSGFTEDEIRNGLLMAKFTQKEVDNCMSYVREKMANNNQNLDGSDNNSSDNQSDKNTIKDGDYKYYATSANKDVISKYIYGIINQSFCTLPKGYKSKEEYAKIVGYALCEKCQQADFNLALAMATTQQESHYGTTGKALKSGQLFNVGQWEGHDAPTIDRLKSIDRYISLIKKNYPGWTNIDTFLAYGGYKNKDGHYYDREDYGPKVRKVYDIIKNKCNI